MARRVNTKFVSILLTVVVVVGGLGLIANRFLIKEHPDKYIALGKEAMQKHDYPTAAIDFSRAASLDPHDPQTRLMLAAAYHEMSYNDPGALEHEISTYQSALEIDPNSKVAVKGLVTAYQQKIAVMRAHPDPESYSRLIRYAQQLHEMDPQEPHLEGVPYQTLIQEWLNHLSVDPQQLADAIDQMTVLMKKDPSDASIPVSIASVKVQQGEDIVLATPTQAQPAAATAKFVEAKEIFKTAFAADNGSQDQNAMMHRNYAALLELLAEQDKSAPDNRTAYLKEASAEIHRARALVKPADAGYRDINLFAAQMAERQGKLAEAEQILSEMPATDLDVVLMQAELMSRDAARLPKAIDMLTDALARLGTDPNDFSGPRFYVAAQLTEMELRGYEITKDPAEKKRLLDSATTRIGRMKEKAPEFVKVLQMEGHLHLVKREYVEAIQSLSRAVATNGDAARDEQVLRMLAFAYDKGNQFNKAIEILKQIVNDHPSSFDSRMQLISLLVRNAPAEARPYLDELEKQFPDDPQLIEWRLTLLAMDKNRDEKKTRAYFDKLSEKTPQEIVLKASLAARLQMWDDAIRLETTLVDKDPADVNSAINLSRLYLVQGKKDKAVEVANTSFKTNPNSDQLKLWMASINGASAETILKIQQEMAGQITDPVDRELTLAELASDHHDSAGCEQHLRAAEKLAPDSPRVWDNLFKFYLSANRLNDAGPYMEKLAGVNYDNAGGLLYRLKFALARNELEKALDLARQLTDQRPEFAVSWISLGDVYRLRGDYQHAIKQYAVALDKQENSVPALMGMIQCYDAIGNSDDAMRYVHQALAAYPHSPDFRAAYIDHLIRADKLSDAITAIQEELKQNGDNPGLWATLGTIYVRTAKLMLSQGRNDDAVANMKYGQDVLTQSLTKWPDEGSLYMAMLELYVAANQPAEAKKVLDQWIDRPSWHQRPEPYQALSNLYQMANQPAAAEDAMQTALARSGYRVDLQLTMSRLLESHNKFTEALAVLRATNKGNPEVVSQIIRVLIDAKRYPEAETELTAAMASNPSNSSELLTIWASLKLVQEQYDAAIAKAEQAMAINPGDLAALQCRGEARLLKSPADLQGAIDDLQRSRALYVNNARIRQMLATAYVRLGRTNEAIVELSAAVKTLPGDKALRLGLVELLATGRIPRLDEALALLKEVDQVPPYNNDPDILTSEAKIFAARQNWTDAIPLAARACEASKDSAPTVSLYCDLLLQAHQYQALLDQTQRLVDQFKDQAWFVMDRGLARNGLGDTAAATTEMTRALTLAQGAKDAAMARQMESKMAVALGADATIAAVLPLANEAWAKLALMDLYTMKKDNASALAMGEKLLAELDHLNKGDQIYVLAYVGHLFGAAKPQPLADRALATYQRLLSIDPDNLLALNDLAMLMVNGFNPPRTQEGLEYAQKAAKVMQDSGHVLPEVSDTEGWLLILSPDGANQGVTTILGALDHKQFPEAYYHLAEGYLKLGNPAEALKQANKGLELLKTSAWATSEDADVDEQKLKDVAARADLAIKTAVNDNPPK